MVNGRKKLRYIYPFSLSSFEAEECYCSSSECNDPPEVSSELLGNLIGMAFPPLPEEGEGATCLQGDEEVQCDAEVKSCSTFYPLCESRFNFVFHGLVHKWEHF